MEFEQFIEDKEKEVAERGGEYSKVELRIVSNWIGLSHKGNTPTYGLYLLTSEDVDSLRKDGSEITDSFMGNAYRGVIPEPDMNLSSRRVPFLCGHEATVNYDGNYSNGEARGYAIMRDGVDDIVYHDSIETATKIAKHFGAEFVDNTSKDLLKLKKHMSGLENQFWNYKERVGD